ncbi:MAG: mandelate racemase/muconate lactonizing enzyme family protein [Rhizobiaceae bacterium]|nr:mandelate racemase/muconate lactonizing enzyme family protein [Rhizobiaceae bacterium]
MKIVAVEDMHADGGWRVMSFLKVTTDAGIVGWSEYHEGMAGPGLTMTIRILAAGLIGRDPRDVGPIAARLYANRRMSEGGIAQQAIAAIVNACLDIKGKAAGLPVYALLGGAQRTRLPVYWSHCGSYRIRHAAVFESENAVPPIRSLDDIVALGREVRERGYRALKTNILLFDAQAPYQYRPGFSGDAGGPELNLDDRMLAQLVDLMSAFRQGAGGETGLLLDLNFNFRPEGVRRIARTMERFGLTWLETDFYNPGQLATIRQSTSTPIGSLEAIYGAKNFQSYLQANAVDVAIVDVQWQGMPEAMKLAQLADINDVNVAAHSAHGFLSTLMGAHMCAAIPNFRILELDVDEVPWFDQMYTAIPVIEDGCYVMPDGAGWGCDVVEEELLRRPPLKTWGSEPWMLDYHRAKGALR